MEIDGQTKRNSRDLNLQQLVILIIPGHFLGSKFIIIVKNNNFKSRCIILVI